jgi:CRP/FNR family transcriptional regulator, cyclic AMP receptor protein
VALSSARRRELLAKVPLFAGLAPRELEALAGLTRSRALAPREELFHKGDTGNHVYAVVEGTLKVVTTSEAGDDVVFNLVTAGEVIGEIAALCQAERTATLVALTDCELLALDRRDLFAFLRAHPDASLELMVVLARRVRSLSELVEDTLFLNLPVRLAKKLVAFAGSHGERVPGGVRIGIKLSQEEWGDLVGATRESINKQMRAWTDQGTIRVDHGFVVILRMEALEELASSSGA